MIPRKLHFSNVFIGRQASRDLSFSSPHSLQLKLPSPVQRWLCAQLKFIHQFCEREVDWQEIFKQRSVSFCLKKNNSRLAASPVPTLKFRLSLFLGGSRLHARLVLVVEMRSKIRGARLNFPPSGPTRDRSPAAESPPPPAPVHPRSRTARSAPRGTTCRSGWTSGDGPRPLPSR